MVDFSASPECIRAHRERIARPLSAAGRGAKARVDAIPDVDPPAFFSALAPTIARVRQATAQAADLLTAQGDHLDLLFARTADSYQATEEHNSVAEPDRRL